jgi:hypothetical protein
LFRAPQPHFSRPLSTALAERGVELAAAPPANIRVLAYEKLNREGGGADLKVGSSSLDTILSDELAEAPSPLQPRCDNSWGGIMRVVLEAGCSV